jgi:hypothetical protein
VRVKDVKVTAVKNSYNIEKNTAVDGWGLQKKMGLSLQVALTIDNITYSHI